MCNIFHVWFCFVVSPQNGDTALADAAYFGKVAAIRFLLDRGMAVDAKSNDGSTALMLAAHKGHVGAMTLLLERGARLDVVKKVS